MKECNVINLCYELNSCITENVLIFNQYLKKQDGWNLILTELLSLADWLKGKKQTNQTNFSLKTGELGEVYCYLCELFFSFLHSRLHNF